MPNLKAMCKKILNYISVGGKLYCVVYGNPNGRVNYTNLTPLDLNFTYSFEFSQKEDSFKAIC